MDPHPRQLQLETWVQAIRDGHIASLWLGRELPAGEVGWVSVPIVVWREESRLRKFANHLRPVPVACSLQTGVFQADFSTRREMRAGNEKWDETFKVDVPMSHRKMRQHLRSLVDQAEQARREVIEWSQPYRDSHTKKASASISMKKGVNEGFLFDAADLRRVSDEMIEVVLTQFDRFAGVDRFDKNGRKLAGRPGVPVKGRNGKWTAGAPIDIEHQVKEYVRSRSRRHLAALLGCTEKDLSSSEVDPSWLPVARSCEYISDVDAASVVSMPALDSRPAAKAALLNRAKNVFETVAAHGGAHQIARNILEGGRMQRRAISALRCPWSGLDDAGFAKMVRYLAEAAPDEAQQDWCDALHWWVAEGEMAPALPNEADIVEVVFSGPEQLTLLAA